SAAGLLPRHDATRRRDDGDAEPAVDARDLPPLYVHAEARLAHPLQTVEHGLLAAAVAQLHLQVRLRTAFFGHHRVVPDEAFILEDLGDRHFDFGCRDVDRIVPGRTCVPDSRQHISDRIT